MDNKPSFNQSPRIRLALYFCVTLLCSICAAAANAQDSPLKISEQPKPALPENYGNLNAQGNVILKALFRADGRIDNIVPIIRTPYNLTELAIEAAQKIKFKPRIKDGEPVDSVSTVHYSYTWHGSWTIPKYVEQTRPDIDQSDAQAEAVLKKAIQTLGGEKYLNVKSQVGRGKFSVMQGGTVVSFQSFVDVIVFPDKERTEFKGGGVKSVQTNAGASGWVYDGEQDLIKIQDEKQIENFRRGIRTSLDNLLRGQWRGEATVAYVGKRPATLGKRNDVVRLAYKDGFAVEFEFAADDGLPQKAIYKRQNADNEEIREEDRYAQFVETDGIKAPYIIDHLINGVQTSRINYETIEYNRPIPDSIFAKPASPKELRTNIKF